MRRKGLVAALAAAVIALGVGTYAIADSDGFGKITETLIGFQEVPAVSTQASGTFTAEENADRTAVDYELTWGGLEGTVTQAHIHFGQRSVNGGISVWLCGNPSATVIPPAGTDTCPLTSPASVSGTFTATDVVGPAGQGIAAPEFAELLRAIDAGKAYANVHSTKFPGGEIRAQLNESGDPHD